MQINPTAAERSADVPAPDRQTLALTLLEVAPTHDRPPGVAGKHLLACFHLVVEVHRANQPREPTDGSSIGLGCMGMSFTYWPPEDTTEMGALYRVSVGP